MQQNSTRTKKNSTRTLEFCLFWWENTSIFVRQEMYWELTQHVRVNIKSIIKSFALTACVCFKNIYLLCKDETAFESEYVGIYAFLIET